MRSAALAVAAPLVALALLAGCGNSRAHAVGVDEPGPATPQHRVSYPRAGVSFTVPRDWSVQPGSKYLVTALTSGPATVAVWRYPRSEPLPTTPTALATARQRLVADARRRDPTLTVDDVRIGRLAGAPTVEVRGAETVAGQRRRMRSTHLYADGGEVVVDAYAAPRWFARVDRGVVDPLLRSLRLAPPS